MCCTNRIKVKRKTASACSLHSSASMGNADTSGQFLLLWEKKLRGKDAPSTEPCRTPCRLHHQHRKTFTNEVTTRDELESIQVTPPSSMSSVCTRWVLEPSGISPRDLPALPSTPLFSTSHEPNAHLSAFPHQKRVQSCPHHARPVAAYPMVSVP